MNKLYLEESNPQFFDPLSISYSAPENRGLYFIYGSPIAQIGGNSLNANILYIGQAASIRSRLHDHHRANQWSDAKYFTYITISLQEELDQIEQILIQRHSPKYNIQHNILGNLLRNIQ